jgi:hypothetical protein
LLAVPAGLRSLGFGATDRILKKLFPKKPGRAPLGKDTVVRSVDLAARATGTQADCLPRAMTLCTRLARHGIASELRFGVARDPKSVRAHAWVEVGGIECGAPRGEFLPLEGRN